MSDRSSLELWEINYVQSRQRSTDDPCEYFAIVDEIRELDEDLDSHARFLLGDWPQ